MITVDYTQLFMQDLASNTRKFYCVFVSSDGRVLRWWGRINTKGQQKEENFGPNGHAAAYAHGDALIREKANKGYRFERESSFNVRDDEWGDAELMLAAEKRTRRGPNDPLYDMLDNSVEEPSYSVGALLGRASELLGRRTVDMDEVAQLRADCKEVEEQLETAKAAIDMLTRKALQ